MSRRREGKSLLSIGRWYWQVSSHFRLQSVINSVIGILVVALDFAFIYATKLAIDIATGKVLNPSLTSAALMLIGIMLLRILISFSQRWISAILGVRAQNLMQRRIFSRLLRARWAGRETRHSGDAINRLELDVRDVTVTVTDTLPAILGVGVRLVGAFVFLYSMDARLALLLLLIAPLFALISRVYVFRMRRLTRQIRSTDSQIQSHLQESLQHHLVLKTLQRAKDIVARLSSMQSTLRQQIRHRTVYSSTSATLINIGFSAGYLVTFLWGVRGLHHQTITYGTMIAFIQLVGQIQQPIRELTRFVPLIIGAFTAGERLMELEDTPLEPDGEPRLFPDGAGVRLKDVSYTYPGNSHPTLSHLSFSFPPGSRTAIVGETGAGKTTLIRLMLALIEPEEGTVEVFNEGDSCAASPQTRCNMLYVPQGNTLLSGTIRYNLQLGDPKATQQEMEEALRVACADFALSLPEGLDSLIGEQGVGLSQGQAQRLCIARALLGKGQILLLDEATSALDTATESRLLDNLTHWMLPSQTLIFVTHRAAAAEQCTSTLRL